MQGLKIKSADLEAPKEVAVKPCRSADAIPVVSDSAFLGCWRISNGFGERQNISAVQTANFLFKLFCERPSEIQGMSTTRSRVVGTPS
jgi:hypothetical protein